MTPEPTAYFLLRFSNNGVFYKINNSNRLFNVFDYNTFSNGQFGRYVVEDGNILKIEFYHHGYRFFINWYGKIDDEKIHFIMEKKPSKWSIKKRISAEDYIFYKQKAMITEKLIFPK